jgi:hypothetical protein
VYLLFSIEDFLDKLLEVKYKEDLYTELSKITGRTERQTSEYVRKKVLPLGSYLKMRSFMSDDGLIFKDDELVFGAEISLSWKGFLHRVRKENPTLIPETFNLIQKLSEKDFYFVQGIQGKSKDERQEAYKTYLINEVVPTYCLEPTSTTQQITETNDIFEAKGLLVKIFFEGVLYLLSHAEAEYLLTTCVNNTSILAKCIPAKDNGVILSPSQKFFALWMQALKLEPKDVMHEMLDIFGETGIADQDIEPDDGESMSRDAIHMQIRRYVKNGALPSWKTLEKWSKGLFTRAIEIQGREETREEYSQLTMDIYGGIRILDLLFHDGKAFFQEDDLLKLLSTYAARYEVNLAAIKERRVIDPPLN